MEFVKEIATDTKDVRQLWVNIPKNTEVTIIPLCDFSSVNGGHGITTYGQFEFGFNKEFWTLPDTGASDDICRQLGLTPKEKYIMPVLLWVDDSGKGKWSEPMYYRFSISVLDALRITNQRIKEQASEDSDSDMKFKGAIIKITRDDSGSFVKYSTSWVGKHWKDKMKGKALPDNDLDMVRGFVPFTYTDDEDYRRQVLEKLISKKDVKVKLNKDDENSVTLEYLLQTKGFLDYGVESEFEMTEDAE